MLSRLLTKFKAKPLLWKSLMVTVPVATVGSVACGYNYSKNRHIKPYMPLEKRLYQFDKMKNKLDGKYYIDVNKEVTEQTFNKNTIMKKVWINREDTYSIYEYDLNGNDIVLKTYDKNQLVSQLFYDKTGNKNKEQQYRYDKNNELTKIIYIDYVFAKMEGDRGHIQRTDIVEMKNGKKHGLAEFYDARGDLYRTIKYDNDVVIEDKYLGTAMW
ncbi:MAG: hypothetical protein Edafosvirus1_10 [Edafosvirus sp.]|uniref:Uncharacterized protein n=1 Tax=Edafosvirus sp. TaxID=2487765 RepID=A0A3G4ZW65_9VIRU|nr:MAG: hypothetical protein Edafosvirus1_10 [Edafosvirus sp.]